MVGGPIPIVANRPVGGGDLGGLPLGDEDLEVPVHRPEGEPGKLLPKRLVNPRRGRMLVGGTEELENALPLSTPMASRAAGRSRGVTWHGVEYRRVV
jgi:hypothetical protein